MNERRTYANTRKVTLALLEILQNKTDKTNPMHIGKMVEKLEAMGSEYAANRDTVKRALTEIEEMFPKKLRHREFERGENGEGYTYGYWFTQPFAFREAEQKVPPQVVKNVKFIRETLRRNEESNKNFYLLSFVFNGYGADGKPHPAGGKQPRNNVLPLKICAAYGNFYLIGIFAGKREPAHFRLDLMTNLVETVTPKTQELTEARRFAMNRLADIDKYIHQHLYMSYETPSDSPKAMKLKISKWEDRPEASLTFLYDAFGGHWKKTAEDDECVMVKVTCTKWALEQFVWQNIERIEEMPDEIETALQEKAEKYFGK